MFSDKCYTDRHLYVPGFDDAVLTILVLKKDKHNQVDRGLKRRAICDGNTMLKRRITGKDDPETFYDLRIMSVKNVST
jgi:hypothetical protein